MTLEQKIQDETDLLISQMSPNHKEIFDKTCLTVRPLVELVNGDALAPLAYRQVITMRSDAFYRAIVTAALFTCGANCTDLALAILGEDGNN